MTAPDGGERSPELERLTGLAELLGLRIDGASGIVGNTVGIRSDDLLFSQRLDSRTYFVQNSAFGTGRGADYRGSDDALLAECDAVAARLGIPRDEVGERDIVREYAQVASYHGGTGIAAPEPAEPGVRYGRLRRRINGHPVWNSSCLLGLTSDGGIGHLLLHWPEVPATVLEEAAALADHLDGTWQDPGCEAAQLESVRAGILHSQAVGFVMEFRAAIRAVYAPVTLGIGRKPVRYLDIAGHDVTKPRNHVWDLDRLLPWQGERVRDTWEIA
ncbi:hypothetical protein ACFQZZ_19680 [Nocardia sp. GCM10030253]|uniref:hypothetical protein n=1 Tax=Nocardia sp. GCM10030253 TaxID=3273404 RepID=UPI003639ABCA